MPEILRVKVKSQGFPGAPGWSTMHFQIADGDTGAAALDAAYAWWSSVKNIFPTLWNASFQTPADVLDLATGDIVRVVSVPPDDQVVLTGGPSVQFGSGVSGACVSWYTDVRINSRKVRGRTFLVPIAAEVWQVDGSLVQENIDILQAASLALINAVVGFGIYTRAGTTTGAAFSPVVAARVSDQAAFLSSRRT